MSGDTASTRPGASVPSEFPPGTMFAHYRLERLLGEGGMGSVFLARDEGLDRAAAVKVLRPEVADNAEVVERFVREARAAARVTHPNLAHVYFVGMQEGRPFFAMEYLPGKTLEALVKDGGPLPLTSGLDLLVQAARGLAAAHGAGVVHRDVKPSNLMVLPEGTLKVADFGLAKSTGGDAAATGGGRILGTPQYITPEQIRSRPVDGRTDVYLLGLTAYYAFAGKPAYGSDEVGEVIAGQLSEPLPSLAATRPDLPPALEALLVRMCDKDPAKRPASMEEVAAALLALRPRTLRLAPLVARAVALGIDIVFAMACTFGLGFAAVALLHGGVPNVQALAEADVLGDLVGLAVFFLVFPVLEWRLGQTLGKRLLDLEVVRVDGNRPPLGPLVGRLALRFPWILLPSALLPWTFADGALLGLTLLAWLAGLVCYFVKDGRTLSDLWTGTRVAYARHGG
jgi:uncharacterized RDD family membrane protein YckC